MEPVRIKYYGLFWMTKRTYFILLLGIAFLVAVLFASFAVVGMVPPVRWPGQPLVLRQPGIFPWVVNNFYPIILALLVAQALDVLFVVRAFAKKEAEQKARLDKLAASRPTRTPAVADSEGIRPIASEYKPEP